jgi:hypothetical protein
VAARLTAAARLVAIAVLLAGCGAAAGSPTVTYPLTTPVPMASITPAVATTRAELARVLGDQRLQLSDPQVPFRPAEGPALAGAPRAIYQVALPEDPTKGYIAVYDLGDVARAAAAGADQAAYLASGPGKVQTPIGTRHVIRQLGPTIVLYSWHPDSAEDPRAPDIQTALESLGTEIPVPS